MSTIPTPEQALELVRQYNKEPFHIQHAETVSKVMGYVAARHDPERVDYWKTVGMLHDIDFELYPDQHCVKAVELLRQADVDEGIIHSVVSHGYGICVDTEPTDYMEKILFATDETHRPHRRRRSHASHGDGGTWNEICSEKVQIQRLCGRLLP